MRLLLSLFAALSAYAATPYQSGYRATLGRIQNIGNTDIAPISGDVGTPWTTAQTINTTLNAAATIPDTAGSGNTWSFYLEYRAAQTTGTCVYTGSPNQTLLFTISGATQTYGHVENFAVNITGPSCFWIHMIHTGGARIAEAKGGTFSMYFAQPILHLQTGASGGIITASNQVFCGQLCQLSQSDRSFWWVPYPTTTVDGVMAITDAPGSGRTWTVAVGVSTTSISNANACVDLTYSYTTVGTIAGSSATYLSWAGTSLAIASGRCIQIRLTCDTGTMCAAWTSGDAGNPNVGLELGATSNMVSFTEPGSGAFDGNHTFGACHWGISDANCGLTLEQQYWIGPPLGLQSVAGVMSFGTSSGSAFSGAGTWNFSVKYGQLVAATDSCQTISYTTSSTFASAVSGDKSINFSFTGLAIPPNACIGLNAAATGGTPTNTSNFTWSLWGAAVTPSGVAGGGASGGGSGGAN